MTIKEIDINVRELFKAMEDNSAKLDRALTLCHFAAEMLEELNESYQDISNRYYFELNQHIKDAIYKEAIAPSPTTDRDRAGAHEPPLPKQPLEP